MVIKHIVMWKLKDVVDGVAKPDNIVKMRELLEGCSTVVPGMGRFEVGVAEPGLASSYDLVLYSEFEDEAALNAYQHHPQHQALVGFVRSVTEVRQCVDYVSK